MQAKRADFNRNPQYVLKGRSCKNDTESIIPALLSVYTLPKKVLSVELFHKVDMGKHKHTIL